MRLTLKRLALLFSSSTATACAALFSGGHHESGVGSSEPNPPSWPSNVYVLSPGQSNAQSIIDAVYSENGGQPNHGQWSNDRYALLFEEGYHDVEVQVGYYTSVMGLGVSPADTQIKVVECQNGDFDYTVGALDNFWRSAENFKTTPYQNWNSVGNSMLWAVSQATPLRRVIIDGNLQLYQYNSGCCAGYASGGYLSDSVVTGTIYSGSQQQWFTRNTKMNSWNGGNWNMVYLGCDNAPSSHCSNSNGHPYTTEGPTPVIAEKPYLHKDSSSGRWYLMVPPVETHKQGPTTNYNTAQAIDFENVYVATESDSASVINSKLAEGKHIVLSAGNYDLNAPINVTKSNTVVLGIGFPTLTVNNGDCAISIVSGVTGVRVSQILYQAGKTHSQALLVVGQSDTRSTGSALGNLKSTEYNFIHDTFGRVGGSNNPNQYQVSTETMAIVNMANTIIDGTWFWRADHDVSGSVYNGDNPVSNGIIVNGHDVIAYGLAAEHTLKDLVVWNGDGGRTYFYQSEFPYDVTSSYGDSGYAGYRVTGNNHTAYGLGVYCYFRDHYVSVENGIVSSGSSDKFVNSLTVFLSGNGEIKHTVNYQGNTVNSPAETSYVC